MMMMKTGIKEGLLMKNYVVFGLLLTGVLLLLPACGRMEPGPGGDPVRVEQFSMKVSLDRWDAPATKAGESVWPDGATLLIQLSSGNSVKPLTVTYAADSDSWQIMEYGWDEQGWWYSRGFESIDFSGFSSGSCKCFYLDGNRYWRGDRTYDGVNVKGYQFDANVAVYGSSDAIFSVQNGVLEISADLKPLTGRIRFTDYPGDTLIPSYDFDVYGLTHYETIDIRTFELLGSNRGINVSIPGEGDSSDYIYGVFQDPGNPSLTVDRTERLYKRSFDAGLLDPGRSSYCYFPTEDHHNEWYMGEAWWRSHNVHQLGLMNYVPGGTFRMGGEDAQPVHPVTLTKDFYISQTEVRQSTWYSVMGEPAEYMDRDDPVYGKSWEEVQEFITKLNAKTGLRFRLPTEAEWEFAARGGLWSNGYRYSGSDDWGAVAVFGWGPATPQSHSYNERWIYDMSGNVSEWVSDWYAPYTEGAVTDPKGPETGEIHVRRGGDCYSGEQYLTVTYRDIDSPLTYTGFRLAADIPNYVGF